MLSCFGISRFIQNNTIGKYRFITVYMQLLGSTMDSHNQITIFILIYLYGHLFLNSTVADTSDESSCIFPNGSIACKPWNCTNMDCSWRDLFCMPLLNHKDSLRLLDLSHNKLDHLKKHHFCDFVSLHTLNISSNTISTINGSVFEVLSNLETLDLSRNKISVIPVDGVGGLRNLINLYLSQNKINYITPDAFSTLKSLENLDISNNQMLFIPDGTFDSLPHLLNLKLAHNFLDIITDKLFSQLTGLQNLDLSFNFLTDIGLTPFRNLSSMQTMSIDQSPFLTANPTMFTGLNHTLHQLHISINSLATYSPFAQLASLEYLELNLATCKNVGNYLFVGLENLKYLKLTIYYTGCSVDFSPLVSLINLTYDNWGLPENKAFIQSISTLESSLQSLHLHVQSIKLNSTSFESLSKWHSSLKKLTIIHSDSTAKEIHVSETPFKWFSKLQKLVIHGKSTDMSATTWEFPNNTFADLPNLKEIRLNFLKIDDSILDGVLHTFTKYSLTILNLAHNEIEGTTTYCNISTISQIKTLQTLDLSYNKMDKIAHLHLSDLCQDHCDLETLNVSHFGWHLSYYAIVTFPWLITFNSSNTVISIYNDGNIIHAPLLTNLFLDNLILTDYYSSSTIKILQIFDAPQLKTLHLASNKISVIDKEDTKKLQNVTFLDLSNNWLTTMNFLQYLHKIEVLLVNGNQITTVSNSILSHNPLHVLDLRDNVLICGCNAEYLQNWVFKDTKTYLWNNFSTGNRYKCLGPQLREGMSLTDVELDCLIPIAKYISLSLISALFTVIAAILILWYRWHIQYKLFLIFNRQKYKNFLNDNNNFDDDFDNEDGVPHYDAYVIYNNQDEDWVDEQLLAHIEEDHDEPFKLCLKNRDIRAGRLIFNELSLHIQRSRKTLVILTPRFVEDNWCYFQLNMAHHRVLEENHNVLIFIILEEIPNNKLTLLLRQLFCKSQCLKWPKDKHGQRLFWQRLREELKRRVPRDDQANRYRHYHI